MAIPDRFPLRQAAQARDDFAQIMDELDLGEAVRPTQPAPPSSAKGAPNRNPEHEHKRSAPNQQDAGNNPAMPTAKFGTSKFCHWFRGPDSRNRVPASQIEIRKGKWSTHLIVNLRKVKMISFQGAWHPCPANSSIPAYAQTPVDGRPTLRWRETIRTSGPGIGGSPS